MFLIFGVKRLKRRLATPFALCGRCGRPAAQAVTRIATWFSLFFVPVVPLGTRYVVTCTFCGQSTKLAKPEATRMLAAAQEVAEVAPEPGAPPPGLVSPPGPPAPPAGS